MNFDSFQELATCYEITMPTNDNLPELPSIFSNPNLDSLRSRSRTKEETGTEHTSKRDECYKFSKTMVSTPVTFFGLSSSWHRSRQPYSILSLLLLLALANSVLAQNSNPLVPTIDNPPMNPLEEGTIISIECKLILTTDLPPANQFPLSWSGQRGLPPGATTTTRTETISVGTRYYSTLTFNTTASVNNNDLTCNAVTPSNSGSVIFGPSVILRPSKPNIAGPTSVKAGEVQTWTCTSQGASLVSPNVYWRNGQGQALLTGVAHSTQITFDSFMNRLYSVRSDLTTALPPQRAEYLLRCVVIHEYQQYSYPTESSLTISVLFPPQVTKTGGNTVLTTETVKTTLSCVISASNPEASSVTWTKDGQPLDFLSGRYEVVSLRSPSLVITQAQKSDAGDYVCSATNLEGTNSFSTPTTLVVRYGPRISYLQGTSFSTSLGATFTLPCPIDANPNVTTVRWKRVSNTGQETYINLANEARYSGSTPLATGLTISPVLAEDQGNFACEAVNDVGLGTGVTISVTVNNDPVINVPSSVTSKEGDSSFTIPCDIQMYPAATSITWYKDNVVIEPAASPSKYLGGTVLVPSLTVLNPAGSDSGSYKCLASNGQGTDITSSDVPVTVIFAPRITASTALLTRDRGQSVTLQVAVEAIPSASSVQWQTSDIDSGSSIRSDLTITGRLSGGTLSNPSLTITGAQPSDAANYYITVTNDEGSTTVGPIPFRVRYEPTNLQVTASPALLQTGQSLTLTCSADAWPSITSYEWTRDGTAGGVIATGAVYTKAQAGSEDYANYRCTVRNSVGSRSATVRPNVQFAPVQNNVGVEVLTTTVGGSVTLICDVTANPTPTYTWYRQVDVIPGAVDRTYVLQVNAATDFDSYSCSAENSVGTLNPAGEFSVAEGDGLETGASIGGDSGLSTATIILIVIIVIIFLIIVILVIIFCCMQGLCAKWCGKDNKTAKVAPTTYTPPQPAPVYMNGGLVGSTTEQTTKVMLDDDDVPNDVDKQFRPLNPGAIIPEISSWAIISVPEKQGPRAHYLPPLTTENENIDNYYREEKRRSRKKRRHRRHKQADDKDALTSADATEGATGNGSPDDFTPGRSGDLESSRSFGRASENVYEN